MVKLFGEPPADAMLVFGSPDAETADDSPSRRWVGRPVCGAGGPRNGQVAMGSDGRPAAKKRQGCPAARGRRS